MVAPHAQTQRGDAAPGDSAHEAEFEQVPVGAVVQEERRRSRFPIRRPRDHGDPELPVAVLARELARSRRYGHPLALIAIIPPNGRPRAAADAATRICRHVRAVDSIWASPGGVFILLPESDGDDASALLARLRLEAADAVDGVTTHVAAFPEDALTAAALLESACGRIARAAVEPPAALRRANRQPASVRQLASADPPRP